MNDSTTFENLGDIPIAHFGVKGMKWGVQKPRGDRSAFRERALAKAGSAKAKTAEAGRKALQPVLNMTHMQKKVAVVAVGTGATITAGLLAGPIGSMAVGGLTRVVETKVTSTTENDDIRRKD